MTSRERTSLVLCGLVAMADGFDAQAIAFVAPRLVTELGIAADTLGVIFAAGLLGLTVGALTLSVLADRLGRRPIILGSVAIFALCSLATASASSSTELLAWRFATGVGLGGALPNVNALAAELAPPRWRATLMTVMFAGFPLGGVVGGLASAELLAVSGWHAVFIVGGIFPLLLLPLLWRLLAESPEFRSRSARPRPALHGPAALFREGRRVATASLWIACFACLLLMYSLLNWLPSVLASGHVPVGRAIVATAMFNAGGIVGGLVIAYALDRGRSPIVIVASLVGAAGCVLALGQFALTGATLLWVVMVAGAGVMGSQLGLNAVIARSYPTALRATALGWALGMGRIGSIVGPIFVGAVMAAQWPLARIFTLLAVPALVAAAAVLVFAKVSWQRAGPAERAGSASDHD